MDSPDGGGSFDEAQRGHGAHCAERAGSQGEVDHGVVEVEASGEPAERGPCARRNGDAPGSGRLRLVVVDGRPRLEHRRHRFAAQRERPPAHLPVLRGQQRGRHGAPLRERGAKDARPAVVHLDGVAQQHERLAGGEAGGPVVRDGRVERRRRAQHGRRACQGVEQRAQCRVGAVVETDHLVGRAGVARRDRGQAAAQRLGAVLAHHDRAHLGARPCSDAGDEGGSTRAGTQRPPGRQGIDDLDGEAVPGEQALQRAAREAGAVLLVAAVCAEAAPAVEHAQHLGLPAVATVRAVVGELEQLPGGQLEVGYLDDELAARDQHP